MASDIPPVKGQAFSFETGLVSQADTGVCQNNPTLADGDVLVIKDGVLDGNIDTLPTAIVGATRKLLVTLSADEMTADRVTVAFHDAAGDEWQDTDWTIWTAAQTLDTTDGIADAILADTGTDGVVLKAAGLDTSAVNEIVDQVWDELIAGHAVVGSTGEALDDASAAGASAADVWSYATRTLTQSAASVTAAVAGSTLTVVKGRTYDATLTGLTIQATWTGVKLTAKSDAGDADTESLLQLVVTNPAAAATDGVLYVDGAAASVAQRLQGDLTVDQAAGTVAIHLQDDLTTVLALVSGGRYDLTEYYTDGAETASTQLTRGVWTVSATETAALA